MNPFGQFADYLDTALKGLIEQGLIERVPQPETEKSDEVRELRLEYGYKLLARDADIEALTAELNEVIQERDNLQEQLRNVTRTLQRAYEAHDVLHKALYQ